MYNLIYTRTALKDIQKLDIIARKRLKKSLERFRENPFMGSVKLTGSKTAIYRFRVGSYRVLFDVKGKDLEILRILHRREAYRNL